MSSTPSTDFASDGMSVADPVVAPASKSDNEKNKQKKINEWVSLHYTYDLISMRMHDRLLLLVISMREHDRLIQLVISMRVAWQTSHEYSFTIKLSNDIFI